MVVGRIKLMVKPGMLIPKPDAKSDFAIKGWGKRRGEDALIYYIPNHRNPPISHTKKESQCPNGNKHSMN